MDAQVQTIVNDLPELGERLRRLEYDERSECAVLDHRESTHLLSVGKGSHRHRTTNYVYANGSSAIAVVDRDQEHYRLRYFEQYNYDTLMGALDPTTCSAIVVRLREEDDTVGFRMGDDDVHLINYEHQRTTSLFRYNYGIGGYGEGCLKIALDRKRSRLAVARYDPDPSSYRQTGRAEASVYGLAGNRVFCMGELPGLSSLDSIDLLDEIDYLAARESTGKIRVYHMLPRRFVEYQGLLLVPATQEGKLVASIEDVYAEVLEALRGGRIALHDLSPRKFEEFMASVFANQGYRVELTKQTHDGGYDILAVNRNPLGLDLRLIIECKRNRPDRPVGLSVVRQLWGVVNDPTNHFDRGILATTSRLSRDAEHMIENSFWRLKAMDHDAIMAAAGFKFSKGLWHPA